MSRGLIRAVVGIGSCSLFCIVILGVVTWNRFWDCNTAYVSDRPDLMKNCGDSSGAMCSVSANSHASDFVPIKQARGLKIAMTQECLAPAPETVVVQSTLAPATLPKYLKDKRLVTEGLDSVIEAFEQQGYSVHCYPFSRLTWWPPPQTPSLRVYAGNSLQGGDYNVFVDAKSNVIAVLTSASRGR